MGHFGRRPIQLAFYVFVLPSHMLCYFGQAALLVDDPAAVENPFYRLAPDWMIPPLAVVATMAAVIASQASSQAPTHSRLRRSSSTTSRAWPSTTHRRTTSVRSTCRSSTGS